MARSAFTGGLFPTLLNHVGPLQGAWGHWGIYALGGTNGATWCVRLLPTAVSAYQVDCGCFCALLGTHCCCLSPCGWYGPPSAPHPPPPPTPPPPAHPPLPLPPAHPPTQPINSIRDITAVGKKLSQNPAVSARW